MIISGGSRVSPGGRGANPPTPPRSANDWFQLFINDSNVNCPKRKFKHNPNVIVYTNSNITNVITYRVRILNYTYIS